MEVSEGQSTLLGTPGHVPLFLPFFIAQKPTKKVQNLSFWLIVWVLFQTLRWSAQPAGTIQYFTERVSNTIETSKYTFGDHMSPLRLPVDFQILVVDKNREKSKKREQLLFEAKIFIVVTHQRVQYFRDLLSRIGSTLS